MKPLKMINCTNRVYSSETHFSVSLGFFFLFMERPSYKTDLVRRRSDKYKSWIYKSIDPGTECSPTGSDAQRKSRTIVCG